MSLSHVTSVWASWQTVPAAMHWLALQVQAATPFDVAHVWFALQVAVVTQLVQLPPGII
jgi:hypothetical protein